MRVKGDVMSQDVETICFNDDALVPLVIDVHHEGCAHVSLPAVGVATTIPASPTAAQIAAALVAAFPRVFTQG